MPAYVYKNSAGIRVPSVTTVLKQLGWSTDALMYWAWSRGIEGENFREVARDAADVGTVAHAYCEATLKGEEFDLDGLMGLDDEQRRLARQCIEAWDEWRDQSKLVAVASEFSSVSEMYQYGGTMDVATLHSKLGILDIKTSKGIYADVLLQLVAYGHLWKENRGEEVMEYHVIRLGKEDGSFHHHRWTAKSLAPAWEAFKHARALYGLEKQLKKKV